MMLDHMDDRTAITYLSTCHSLLGGYHQYPLKQAMSELTLVDISGLELYLARTQRATALGTVHMGVVGGVIGSLWTSNRVGALLFALALVPLWRYRVSLLRRPSVACCEAGTVGGRRRLLMPRVTKLSAGLRDMRLLPYLQHLTELTIRHDKRWRPFDDKYPLPHSLRTLHLLDSPGLMLEADTLPPRLTSLSLGAIKNESLSAGVLPQSLTSLELTRGFDARCGETVLPSNLQRLELDEWKPRLSNIVLPATLTELDIRWLSNHPLPVLPSQLEVLAIGGAFSQPLIDALPSSLRVLRLTGFEQPLTASAFASTPQLEELYLKDDSPRELDVSVLPRSLRVLRLGKLHTLVVSGASDLPPQLHRVIVPAGWDPQWMSWLQHLGQMRGFTVEEQQAASEQTST